MRGWGWVQVGWVRGRHGARGGAGQAGRRRGQKAGTKGGQWVGGRNVGGWCRQWGRWVGQVGHGKGTKPWGWGGVGQGNVWKRWKRKSGAKGKRKWVEKERTKWGNVVARMGRNLGALQPVKAAGKGRHKGYGSKGTAKYGNKGTNKWQKQMAQR